MFVALGWLIVIGVIILLLLGLFLWEANHNKINATVDAKVQAAEQRITNTFVQAILQKLGEPAKVTPPPVVTIPAPTSGAA